MIFHENRLLVDDSHIISYLIFVENWEKSAAVVIGALRVKHSHIFQERTIDSKIDENRCKQKI